MRKVKNILKGNILSVDKVDGLDGYILVYFDQEQDNWVTTHIDKVYDMFKIPYDEELCLDLGIDDIAILADNNIVSFDNKLGIYKIFFYDDIYNIANDLITKYIKDNKLDNNLLLDHYSVDDYFKTLWNITIDYTDNIVKFSGISGYIEDAFFKFPIQIISNIIDVEKLKRNVENKFNIELDNITIPCMNYITSDWYDSTIFVTHINDDDQCYTYKLFEDCDFIKK